ncbi:MAG: CGNR zinc finger domain-containing protein [Solirubrobacterales bacterium]
MSSGTSSHIDPDAELIRDFVNTRDLDEGVDLVSDPASLAAWVRERASIETGAPSAAEHRRVLALREALRAMLHANNGAALEDADLEPLREAADRTALGVVTSRGEVRVRPSAGGLAAFEAALLLAVAGAQERGTWARLKACPAADCRWAFYDRSRNRSRTWCSMEECGNRSKTRSYRARVSGRSGS